ncbi:MAG TPA: hypothetical protein PK861_00420 [Thermomonas sp.]|nr:hypothetical protein [Thermomonas sp.]
MNWTPAPEAPSLAMVTAGMQAMYAASHGDIDATAREVSATYRAMLAKSPTRAQLVGYVWTEPTGTVCFARPHEAKSPRAEPVYALLLPQM